MSEAIEVQESLQTTAVRLSTVESNSPEWHELRSTGVGGSEVAAIVGVSKWESAYTLWAKKTGKIDKDGFSPSEAAEWGTRLEPIILDKFESEHPDFEVFRELGTWHHSEYEWMRANPDAIAQDRHTGELVVVEVKTAAYEDDWVDGPPPYYLTQVQWYLDVFGYQKAIFAVLFHGNKYAEFEVKADPAAQLHAIWSAIAFLECVDEGRPPAWDGSSSTLETVRKIHPQIVDETVELGEAGQALLDAKDYFDELEREFTKHKSIVLDAMGLAKFGTVDGVQRFQRSARGQGLPFLMFKKGKNV